MTPWQRRLLVFAFVGGTIVLCRYAGWGQSEAGISAFDVFASLAVVLAVVWFGWVARLTTGGTGANATQLRARHRGATIVRRLGDIAMAPALIWAAYGLMTTGALLPVPLWVMLLFVAGLMATFVAEIVSWARLGAEHR